MVSRYEPVGEEKSSMGQSMAIPYNYQRHPQTPSLPKPLSAFKYGTAGYAPVAVLKACVRGTTSEGEKQKEQNSLSNSFPFWD